MTDVVPHKSGPDGKADEESDNELVAPDLGVQGKPRFRFVDDVNERMLSVSSVTLFLTDSIAIEYWQSLQRHEWFHGCLPYEDIVGLLQMNGDFLLREVGPDGERAAMACVTVKWNDIVQNYPIHCYCQGIDRQYTIDGVNKCADVIKIIQYHYSNSVPIGNIYLKRPIPKQRWELTSSRLKMQKLIGGGKFGEVWKGTMIEDANKPPIDVAIKVGKINNENKEILDEMHREARLMRQYKHRNVVAFYGVVLESAGNVMIVMEMVNGGGLDKHLKKQERSLKEKFGYTCDAALGLLYLHSKGCMHRDVACRNCLIDLKSNVVKISDFGMSKQGESYTIPHHEVLPIRWQAPEVILTRIYTMKSDVYSFGILLWEIFHNAEHPFDGIDNKTIREKISSPRFRPPVNPATPLIIQKAMRACWRADPKKRPTMEQTAKYLYNAPIELLQANEVSDRPGQQPKSSLAKSARSKKKVFIETLEDTVSNGLILPHFRRNCLVNVLLHGIEKLLIQKTYHNWIKPSFYQIEN
ncbi:SH2 domain protein [Dictyocaulus viviparus]|uniref:Tyrosine-protein kinase n=1 Tax=Dictyocaulus viviparus TaxID=29172 RepID=A0A0D8XST7_DICVI|nr:SH2 domain protein [Dictyocaulus viviparus]